ncbi:calcitonin gene-related peptide type 1 receptor isoform X1 [Rhopalosiphum padi]|uniref:calcitonin gene-related peptide type 1 receptor isoform X1 n=1 Tax=Rhopalosiphum padi TaxID=40932 RepID=UPI00298DA231|nr:calcitonin gene-related peptide type 1 receptor isoform X1 [Rhopalosiphum padi]XP_060841548.1 calcitonin gene-related peptide type 1 receptor isoform X1 [Rhopalosiphum padi]XP_060841549.1 calcitonin gene-related peptide type 1 receptor isoform X1 [Rhopalosiphum padi]XP_060841550.1 calcitonin gene-related peptide type 1 receptor isoform X1 [Rhopalosiphum padi]
MTTESPTGISAEFQNHLRSECELKLNETVHTHPSSHFCRGTFDGWLCWADTEAGVTVHQPCPEFISGFDPTRTAYKICNKNATWFKHPISGAVWSNYTTCINHEDYNWTQQINNIYQTGYLVSFIALLLSIAILTYFKSLRCARNTLHTHMFTSFAINNLLWLLWYRLVVEHPSVVLHNGWWCQILHVVLHYFLLTNYAWMLAEGFYLHTLLVFAFTSEDTLVRWSWTLAWSTPLVVISLYTLLRISNDHTSECWINESPFSEVLVVPVCMSMALNLVFLCNIVRVLWVKLQAGPSHLSNSTPSRTLLQAFRATLLLLPLLGLHYLLTPFRPPKQHPWEPFYEVVSATTSSFQGLCVATLFCFLNGEVVAQIKRRWQFMFFRTRANSYTATTVSVRQFVRSTAGPGDNEDKV